MKKASILLGGILTLYGLSTAADLYVAPTAQGSGNCSSQADACELQTALTTAQNNGEGDTIFLMPGTYNFTSNQTYETDDGDGGNPLTIKAFDSSNRPVVKGKVVIRTDTSGNGGDTGGDVVVEGINFSAESHLRIITRDANLTVQDCLFEGMSSGGMYTGGIAMLYAYYAKGVFKNNIVRNNSLNSNHEGIVYISTLNDRVEIFNNLFYNNRHTGKGGALYSYANGGTVVVYNNTFYNNTANEGGAFYAAKRDNNNGSIEIYNNIFWNNTAEAGGNDGDDVYVNSDHNSDNIGGKVNIHNNIFGLNADTSTAQSEDLFINYTDNYGHANNISQDPKFINASSGDLRISENSPAVDKGTDALPLSITLPSKDIRGEDRITDGDKDSVATVDIGAYEYTEGVDVIPSGGGGSTGGGGGGGGCSSSPVSTIPFWSFLPFALALRRLLRR